MKISRKITAILVLGVAFMFATTAVSFAGGYRWHPIRVEVFNPEDNPVPVFDVDTQLCIREVLTARASGFTNEVQLFGDDFSDSMVPEGKILVMEMVSASMSLPQNERPLASTKLFYEQRVGANRFLSVPLTFIATDPNTENLFPESYAASYKVKIYVPPGERLSVSSGAEQTKGVFGYQIMGYLVSEDCPRP